MSARPRIVVGIERLLRPAAPPRARAQVDADAVQVRRAAAHARRPGRRPARGARTTSGWRAFQRSRPASASSLNSARAISITGIDVLRRPVGVGREPAHSVGSPRSGRRLHGRRPFRGDIGGGRPPRRVPARARTWPARARRLDARRLAGLLRVVRRPRRVAQPLGLVARATARAARRASRPPRRCRRAGRRSRAKRAGTVREREVRGIARRHLVPGQRHRHARVRRRPHRVGARRPCGPWRSGCSRGRRRGAPPSTTCWSPASGARRSTSRASASAARRTSVERPARLDPHVDVDAARARRLGPADEPEVVEHLARDQRDRADLRPTPRRAPDRDRRAARRDDRGRRRAPGAGSGRCSRG